MSEEKKYAFHGRVMRLTLKDYDNWYNCFYNGQPENDYYNALCRIDNWMASRNIEGDTWYFIASSLLEKDRKRR